MATFKKIAESSYINRELVNAVNFITTKASPDGKPYVEVVFNQWGLQIPAISEVIANVKDATGLEFVDELPEETPATEGEIVTPGAEDSINPSDLPPGTNE